jgi:hypothetical protein
MNLFYYHAELCKLVRRAFPTLSDRQRDDIIHERFISGIYSDIIRGQLLASSKITNVFGRMFRSKTLLDGEVEVEEIYGKNQVNINLVRTDKANIVCYRCHYANDCRAQNKPSQNINQNNQRSQNGYQNHNSSSTNIIHFNEIEFTIAITGSCMPDGQSTVP